MRISSVTVEVSDDRSATIYQSLPCFPSSSRERTEIDG